MCAIISVKVNKKVTSVNLTEYFVCVFNRLTQGLNQD